MDLNGAAFETDKHGYSLRSSTDFGTRDRDISEEQVICKIVNKLQYFCLVHSIHEHSICFIFSRATYCVTSQSGENGINRCVN